MGASQGLVSSEIRHGQVLPRPQRGSEYYSEPIAHHAHHAQGAREGSRNVASFLEIPIGLYLGFQANVLMACSSLSFWLVSAEKIQIGATLPTKVGMREVPISYSEKAQESRAIVSSRLALETTMSCVME